MRVCAPLPGAGGCCTNFPHLRLPPRWGAPLRAASAASRPAAAGCSGTVRSPGSGLSSESLGTRRAWSEAGGLCAVGSSYGGEKLSLIFTVPAGKNGGRGETGQLRSGFCCFLSEKCGCRLVCVAQQLSLSLLILPVIFLLGIT